MTKHHVKSAVISCSFIIILLLLVVILQQEAYITLLLCRANMCVTDTWSFQNWLTNQMAHLRLKLHWSDGWTYCSAQWAADVTCCAFLNKIKASPKKRKKKVCKASALLAFFQNIKQHKKMQKAKEPAKPKGTVQEERKQGLTWARGEQGKQRPGATHDGKPTKNGRKCKAKTRCTRKETLKIKQEV